MTLRSVPYPALASVAVGSYDPIGINPLGFSLSENYLWVKTSYIDSAYLDLCSDVFGYDLVAKNFTTDLGSLLVAKLGHSGTAIASVASTSYTNVAQGYTSQEQVLVLYKDVPVEGRQADTSDRLAVIQNNQVVDTDLIAHALSGYSSYDLNLRVSSFAVANNGRYVALVSDSVYFTSTGFDTNDKTDVFLLDRETQQFYCVSQVEGAIGNGDSTLVDIRVTTQGHLQVLIESDASSFSSKDQTNGLTDVYLWDAPVADLTNATLTLVSQANSSATGGSGALFGADKVYYQSTVNGLNQINVYDLSSKSSQALAVTQLSNSVDLDLLGVNDAGTVLIASSSVLK